MSVKAQRLTLLSNAARVVQITLNRGVKNPLLQFKKLTKVKGAKAVRDGKKSPKIVVAAKVPLPDEKATPKGKKVVPDPTSKAKQGRKEAWPKTKYFNQSFLSGWSFFYY